jgi:glycosyltransferase involved in cell wall biosynthesis
VVLALARNLKSLGAYDPVIGIASWGGTPQPSVEAGVDVVSLRLRPPFLPGVGPRSVVAFLRTLPSDVWRLASLIRKRRIEVINAHFPDLNMWVIALLKALGVFRGTLLLSFHGADVVGISETRGIHRAAWRALISRADRVVACSEALASDLVSFAPRARVVAIHNGVDLQLFGRPCSGRPVRRRILHVGKFERKKGQDVILEAFRVLLQRVPDASLVLVGAEGPELAHVRAQVGRLGLEGSVEIHVNVPHEQVPYFMERADLFLLPSRSEPFGIVLLEAGAAGLPVVASRVGGIPELIEDGRTGLLLPPDDAVALEHAMRRVLTEPEMADRLALAWHDRVVSGWSWDRTCTLYLDAIASCAPLCEQSPPAAG